LRDSPRLDNNACGIQNHDPRKKQMATLIVKYPDRSAENFPLARLRITIGRSARNDLCIPDPFASRVHAEVRNEGDDYIIQDLGSANGTLYNGVALEEPAKLTSGGRIQIGETEIVFSDGKYPLSSGATMITDEISSSLPEATIALASARRSAVLRREPPLRRGRRRSSAR